MDLALCVNFNAEYLSGQPSARRRGRVFLGPFASDMLDSATGRPKAARLSTFQGVWDTFLTASQAASGWEWAVHSPTDNLTRPVVAGWLDDTWDTMRSRDFFPSVRYPF